MPRSHIATIAAGTLALLVTTAPVAALTQDSAGFYKTGEGVRKKRVALVKVDVYRIAHFMKELPADRSKAGVIAANTEKKLVWTMLRDVDHEKIVSTLRDAYAMNGYADTAKIERFVSAFSGELKKGATVTIHYEPTSTRTSVRVGGGGSAAVEGSGFMKGTWSIWFGKIDQPSLGDALIADINK